MKLFTLSTLVAVLSINAAPTFAGNPTTTTPAAQTKVSYKEAKTECLKEDANLKGPALKNCIHTKRKLAGQKG